MMPRRPVQIAAALAALLVLGPALPAGSQGVVLPALSTRHVLMLGSPTALGDDEARMRFSLDGAFVTGAFDADRQRQPVDGTDFWEAGLNWDASFDVANLFEIGVRLRLAWERAGSSERVGPQLIGAAVRYQAVDQERGLQLAFGLAAGQELVIDPGRVIEADVALRAPIAARAWLDAEINGTYGFGSENDPLSGAVVVGPVWQPVDVFSLVFELQGRYGKEERAEVDFWDLTAALRLGFELGAGHELALSGWRTLYGRAVPEQTAALLQWRVRWQTDGGLLELDNDAEMVPAHLTDTWDEGAPSDEGEGADEPESSEPGDETAEPPESTAPDEPAAPPDDTEDQD